MHDGSFPSITMDLREPTIGEISHRGLFVMASCECGHHRKLIPERICISSRTEISDVGSVLTCSRCGTRGLSTRVAARG